MSNQVTWTDDAGAIYNANPTRPLPVVPYNGAAGSYTAPVGDANGTVVQAGLSSTFWNYAPGTGGVVPSASQTQAKAAGAAGVRNYVMSAQISHAALGAAVELIIQDGSTTLWRGSLTTAATDAGGFTVNFDPPLRGTAATAVNYTFSGATTGGVYVNLQGYTGT